MSGAAVHPGDCGALVADASGHLVGLVHYTSVPDSGGDKAPPVLAFAVPAAWVKFSADRIIRHGRMVRGWLGASLLPLSDAARSKLGLAPGVGAEVAAQIVLAFLQAEVSGEERHVRRRAKVEEMERSGAGAGVQVDA